MLAFYLKARTNRANTSESSAQKTRTAGYKNGGVSSRRLKPRLAVYMHMCVCVSSALFRASEHQHAASQREEEEVVAPTQPKGLWPPCQRNLFSTSGPPSLAASPFSPPCVSPLPPRPAFISVSFHILVFKACLPVLTRHF